MPVTIKELWENPPSFTKEENISFLILDSKKKKKKKSVLCSGERISIFHRILLCKQPWKGSPEQNSPLKKSREIRTMESCPQFSLFFFFCKTIWELCFLHLFLFFFMSPFSIPSILFILNTRRLIHLWFSYSRIYSKGYINCFVKISVSGWN